MICERRRRTDISEGAAGLEEKVPLACEGTKKESLSFVRGPKRRVPSRRDKKSVRVEGRYTENPDTNVINNYNYNYKGQHTKHDLLQGLIGLSSFVRK
jgi:hypothetical protein